MGRIRGKDEVSEPRKPKKRGSKHNRPTWQEKQPAGPWEE